MTNQVLETLVAARALIARPECWTQGFVARTQDGKPCGFKDAFCFCSIGAIGSAGFGVEGCPIRTENKIKLTIAIDVECGDADVVGFGCCSQDGAHFPGWIFVPDYPMLIDHNDVGP